MGNSNSSSNRGRHGDSKGQQKSDNDSKSESKPSVILPTEPGRPIVKLTKIKTDDSELTDEITLKWKGPSRRGNVKIQGYLVEMWDLGMNEWVRVVGTDDPGVTECRLSNILSGMLYRFRVSAVTDAGLSLPSLPSEAFVINIPGVNIAPYWVTTPNHKYAYKIHDTLHFRLEALGTPHPNFHWYKDDEQIFLADGISMVHTQNATELIVDNLQPEDVGVLRCSAVNTIGRINWETKINLISPPEFDVGGLRRKYRFREDEIIRIKCPLISIPKPDVRVYRRENEMKILMESGFVLIQSIDNIVFKIESASTKHTGIWTLEAANEHGVSDIELNIKVESVPKIPSRPTVEVGLTDVMLSWDHDTDNNSAVRYLIEYYRDQWALWLKAKYSNTSENILVSDLIPGSYYKFRVKAINNSGTSDPSEVSESVMIRGHVEDIDGDLEDLVDKEPYFSQSNSRRNKFKTESFRRKAKFASLSELSVKKKEDKDDSTTTTQSQKERQASLEREVYYDKDTRKEVVTYFKPSVHEKYNMTRDESDRYKRSMSELCSKLLHISSHSLQKPNYNDNSRPSNLTQSTFFQSKDQLHESNFLESFTNSNHHRYSLPDYPPGLEPPIPPPRRLKKKKRREKSAVEKRIERRNAHRSLSEIRGRISSLQNLLFSKKDETMRQRREEELSSKSLHSLSFFLEAEDKIRPAPKVISVQNLTGLLETHFLVDSDENIIDNMSEQMDINRSIESSQYNISSSKNPTDTEEDITLVQSTNDCTSRTLIPDDSNIDSDVSYSSIDLD
ncbi:uncharacterized protein [Lepeophtheirus salmonis]|uniref:uncharacterized protein n=1 Tax=Lepeophtheirus salmonis TaxID=72036 RepID=UPI001AEB0669|nr:titin homolog [Lepeophtheirus salmonis]XP_040580941.1 titin homolog [Lepeophtheirus salmonis]